MPRIPAPFPIKGISDALGDADQLPLTTRDGRNVRVADPVTGRLRGGQRSGMEKFCSVVTGAGRVRRIDMSITDAKKQVYVDLGNNATVEFAIATPGKVDSKAIAQDSQSNLYVVNGNAGVAKFNSAGYQLWVIAFPSPEKEHEVLALAVDPIVGTVIAGVTSGGRSDNTKMWGYRQMDDNQTDLLWTIEPGGFVKQLRFRKGLLYALLDYPDRNRSYVRVYGSLDTEEPEFQKEWEVPYPANDLDVSPTDEHVFVASDANTARGTDPRSAGTTQTSQDFTPYDLTDFKKRIWGWWDPGDRSTLSLLPKSANSGDDGAEVEAIFDKMKSGRNWYANKNASFWPAVPPGERGPIYRQFGVAGLPTLSFSGEVYDGGGDDQTTGRSMVGEPASSVDRSYREEQLSPLPTYKGAQFALFMVVKCGLDDKIRGLLSIPKASDAQNSRQISINRRDDNNLPGTIPMPGSVCLREPAGLSGGGAGGPSGPNTVTPGALSGSGLAIITWICDGGVDDQVGTPTRSTFRLNGQPVDRWLSKPFSTDAACTLGIGFLGSEGHSRFAGELCEMFVLSDWYDKDGNQQRLITVPTYPDSIPPTSGAALSDTECERIEGYLAHKHGMAHELPSGRMAYLEFTGQPNDGDTVTIDSVVYTFRNAVSVANDVKIGSSYRVTATNFYQAVDRTGEPGVDYGRATVQHPTYMAMAAVEEGNPVLHAVVGIRSRSPYGTFITPTEVAANVAWLQATTTQTINGAGSSIGHYPHPFALKKTNFAPGGPPKNATNVLGQTTPSYLLQSIYPQLTKWSPNSGKLIWNATTGLTTSVEIAGTFTDALALGGIGYAVRVNSHGEIYSAGPPIAAVVSGAERVSVGNDVDLQKFGDTGTAPVTTAGGTGDPWYATLFASGSTPSQLGWARPRMDVDGFDNLYVPIYYIQTGGAADPYANVSVVGYRRASTGVALGDEFLRYASLPFLNETYAVLADPKMPELPKTATMDHGEFLYLGGKTESLDPDLDALFKLRQIRVDLSPGGTQRTVVPLVVNDGVISTFTDISVTPISGGTLDSSADFIDSTALYGNVYFTDGKSYLFYNAKTGLLEPFQSRSSGLVQPRCKLITSWRGRLVLARPPESPQNWFMSKQGDPFNWDQVPFTLTGKTSIAGNDSRAGVAPDIINALLRYSDDTLLVFCDHSIHVFRGDPMDGGQLDLVTDAVGGAFGRSCCKDPEGMIYFADNNGEVYRMSRSGKYESLTEDRVSSRLRSVDLSNSRLELTWNSDDSGLHVLQFPYVTDGVPLTHWFWEKTTNAWWEDTFGLDGATGVQPTAVYPFDSDDPEDRALLFGCEDGFIRKWTRSATSDDGQPIWSFVMIGPLVPKGDYMEWMFTDIDAVFATGQQAPNWYLYGSKVADRPGHAVSHGRFRPGRNATVLARARGAASYFAIGLAEAGGRWSYEDIQMRAEPMGRKRARV